MATRTTNHNKSARTGSGNNTKTTKTAPLTADSIDVVMVDYNDTKATMIRRLPGPLTSKMTGWVIIDGHKHYGVCDQLTDGGSQWNFHTMLKVPLADNQNSEPVASGDPANDDDDATDEGDAETKNGG